MEKYLYGILKENVSSFDELHELQSLTEAEDLRVSNQLLTNIMKSAIEKSHVDFDTIPSSKGRIEKYKGFENMKVSLDYLDTFSKQAVKKIPEVETVMTAIKNIGACGDLFEKGFKLENQFVMVTYNSLVLACIEATSGILSSYMSFMQTPSDVEFKIVQNSLKPHAICLSNLARFNDGCMRGEMRKALVGLLEDSKKNLLGAAAGFIGAHGAKILAVTLIIPIIRELIYLFYSSRLKASEYLKQQAEFVELTKLATEKNMNMSADKRNKIIGKQKAIIRNLERLSDKIAVDYTLSEKKSIGDMGKENKSWSLSNVQNDVASSDANGFQLI